MLSYFYICMWYILLYKYKKKIRILLNKYIIYVLLYIIKYVYFFVYVF